MSDVNSLRERMQATAEQIIVYLEASETACNTRAEARDKLDAPEPDYRWADRCIPITDDALPDQHTLIPDRHEMMFWPRWTPVAVFEDKDGPDSFGPGSIIVSAIQPCNAKEARRRGASVFSPHMGLMRFAVVTPGGARRIYSIPVCRVGGLWRVARSTDQLRWGTTFKGDPYPIEYLNPRRNDDGDDSIHARFQVQQGLLLAARYRWSVTLRIQGSIGVRLLLRSCASTKELFRLRDAPPGKQRRAALRHWVETHWRAVSNTEDQEMLTLVRGHLRGGTRFRWNGLDVEIEPAEYDIERVAELKAWREQLREAGLDRRLVAS